MALTFSSGATNSLNVTRYTAIEPTGSVSFACWLKRNGTLTNGGRVFEKEYADAGLAPYVSWGIECVASTTGVKALAGQTTGTLNLSPEVTLPDGVWAHVCGTFAVNDFLEVFLDGVSGGTTPTANANLDYVTDATGKVDIGGYLGGTSLRFNGDIAECAFWSAKLTAGEISALARGYAPTLIRPASLKLYVPLVRDVYEARTAAVITTNGSPAAASHPHMIYPRRKQAWSPAAAAASTASLQHIYRHVAGIGA